jgi:hypothetical protein
MRLLVDNQAPDHSIRHATRGFGDLQATISPETVAGSAFGA